jgi:glutathione S-transferase
MTIQISAFRWVPPMAQGYVKDLRVRWALEEAGLSYEEMLIDAPSQAGPDYRGWQPFGQVPAYRDEAVELFESGAIVLHIAARSPALAPQDEAGRARVGAWVLAALNSIEPPMNAYIHRPPDPADAAWTQARAAALDAALDTRLTALAAALGERDYLEGRFTAGDLMMTTVIRELVDSGVLARHPTLDALRARCEARPAFARAMAAHLRPFGEGAIPP